MLHEELTSIDPTYLLKVERRTKVSVSCHW